MNVCFAMVMLLMLSTYIFGPTELHILDMYLDT
jgi:hypothetical protein